MHQQASAGDFGGQSITAVPTTYGNQRFKPYGKREKLEYPYESAEFGYVPDPMSFMPPEFSSFYPNSGGLQYATPYGMPPAAAPMMHSPTSPLSMMDKVYTSLCVSNLKKDADDAEIAGMLRGVLQDYPDCSIQFSSYMKDRVVYLNFTSAERAQQLYYSIENKFIQIPDRMVYVEPVYASRRNQQYSGMEPVSSKHKFPHHLDHKAPEDDHTATRTLFVGNLDPKISRNELIHIFGQFGEVFDIDWKQPTRKDANAFAFVMYKNVQQAYAAKVQLSGKKIGRYYCKIGYGKIVPTNCIWIGNIDSSVLEKELIAELKQFGPFLRYNFNRKNGYCLVLYECLDDSKNAIRQLRGITFESSERALQVDYVKIDEIDTHENISINHLGEDPHMDGISNIVELTIDSKTGGRRRSAERKVLSIIELSTQLPVMWHGFFIVKNTAFSIKLHLLHGERDVESILGETHIKVSQRMKLDDKSCEQVFTKCKASLLALAHACDTGPENLELRQAKQFINYFKSKNAGGIVTNLDLLDLYILPPCKYVEKYIEESRPEGVDLRSTQEYMLVFIHPKSKTAADAAATKPDLD